MYNVSNIMDIGKIFIVVAIIITFVVKTIALTENVYNALLGLKRGNMTFSDVILQMYDELYGTVDEEEAS